MKPFPPSSFFRPEVVLLSVVLAYLQQFGLTFIPLFVAMDALGTLPFLLSLTTDMSGDKRRETVRQAILTALGVGVAFMLLGKGILFVLGIQVNDFLVAGGLILLGLAAAELLFYGRKGDEGQSLRASIGVVPIGTPLVTGPGVLTTLLVLAETYSWAVVLMAFVANLAFAYMVFRQANGVARFFGEDGLKAIAKVASLLLAAIAVKMIRQGLMGMLSP